MKLIIELEINDYTAALLARFLRDDAGEVAIGTVTKSQVEKWLVSGELHTAVLKAIREQDRQRARQQAEDNE